MRIFYIKFRFNDNSATYILRIKKHSIKTRLKTDIFPLFFHVLSIPGPVSRMSFISREILLYQQKRFLLFNFPLLIKIYRLNIKQPNYFLSMYMSTVLMKFHWVRIVDDSRFSSGEKHMLQDSNQPFNERIIDLAFFCTIKYQTSVFCIDLARKNFGLFFTVHTSR